MLDATHAQGKPGKGLLAQGPRGQGGTGQGLLPPPPPPPPLPESQEDLDALQAKRVELGNQLEGMTDRREELADQLTEATGPARPGLQERIQLLDERSARVEREIAQLDDAIAAGLARGLGFTEKDDEEGVTVHVDEGGFTGRDVAVFMVGEALALVLLGMFLFRRMLRRAREQFAGSPNDPARMDHLQNAVDAIAVEVERISEGQRYVTKVLNAGGQPELVAGQGQEAVPARRKGS